MSASNIILVKEHMEAEHSGKAIAQKVDSKCLSDAQRQTLLSIVQLLNLDEQNPSKGDFGLSFYPYRK